MKKKLIKLLPIFAVMLVLLVAYKPVDRLFEIQKNLDIFTTLYKEINTYYVDEVNPSTIMKTGIDAMLNSLDPYTNYIPEDEIEDYRTMTTGQYGGIGALVGTRDGKSTILMPYENYPAYKTGLKIGDEIIKINGIPLKNKTQNEVSKLLKGQAGTNIKLEVKSLGQNSTKEFEFKRETIKIDNVKFYSMVSTEVGYLSLTDFTQNATKEVKNAIEKLKEQGAKKIILDLRGNPGGLLSEAVNISNLFIPRESDVVSTKGKVVEWNKMYKALNPAYDTELPLIVLINGRSASAAEIVAGVVQDYDRGVLIGQKSFGKGLVQATRPLSYNSQLKVTTAKYYTPSGRCIQAIDYGKRKADGTVDKFADSLRKEFKTKNGRKVYDGAGVDPDIAVPAKKASAVLIALKNKNLLFDYAGEYFLANKTIKAPQDFKLTESEYNEFVKWVKTKNVTYTTQTEKILKDLEEKAKDERTYGGLEAQIKSLHTKSQQNKEADLLTFKEEIRQALESEIVAFYYFEKGQNLLDFNYDADLKMALEIFKDMNKYQELLKGKK
ncbi:MAG: S41 family peptidase [Bacteroidetes bacterium]|nr:MAG: S41 family peptidase [Bacteroidota bacterium]TAG87988.1 MAG: S41 family peptidase [Bacteroidota bacterium]